MDKKMRLHSVTSTIENGFVYLPDRAAWLEEYLHELCVFPNGKHDDQADSTSQALDWFKKGGTSSGHGLVDYWLKQMEEAKQPPKVYPPILCPKCGRARSQYGNYWKCNVCGASGTDETRPDGILNPCY